MAADPSSRLKQAAFEYENLLLKAGRLVRPDCEHVSRSPQRAQYYNSTHGVAASLENALTPQDDQYFNQYAYEPHGHVMPSATMPPGGADATELFDLMNSMREEIKRLKYELDEVRASSNADRTAEDERREKMAHEIFEMRAIYDSKIDSLQLENMELQEALSASRKELQLERRELLRAASIIEKQKRFGLVAGHQKG